MHTRRVVGIITVLAGIALMAAHSAIVAAPSTDQTQTLADVQVAGTVLSQISYQGRLTDGQGNPLQGSYNLDFQLFDQASGGTTKSTLVMRPNTQVSNGLFTVKLDVPQDSFNGQSLWIQISVNGQALTPRQELLPVPYAMSLRPGAEIYSPGPNALEVHNGAGGNAIIASSQNNIAVVAESGSVTGLLPTGIHAVHGTSTGVGLYGQGGHTGVYGNGETQGVKGESVSGDGVLGATTSTQAGAVGVRARNQGAGAAIACEGDLYATGAFRGNIGPNHGAPYPRPAYDSGWVGVARAQDKTLTHNVGGNVDNYVVDLQFKATSAPFGIHNISFGGDLYSSRREGGYYKNLTNSSIILTRFADDLQADLFRVRIWVYK